MRRQQVAPGFLFRTTGFEALQANQTVLEQRLKRRGDSLPHLPQYFPPGNGAMFQQEPRSSIWRVAVGLTAHGGSQRSTHSSLAAASSRGPSNSAPSRIHASPSAPKPLLAAWANPSAAVCALPLRFHRTETHLRHPKPQGSTIARICPGVTAWRKASWRTISMCPDGSKGSFSRGQSMGRTVTPSGRGEPSPRTTPIRNIPLPSGTATLKPGHHANPASHSGTA